MIGQGSNKQFYIYVVNISLVSNQTLDTALEISADADFIIEKISITATSTNVNFRFFDTGSSREWTNGYINLANLCPEPALNGRNLLKLPEPIKLSKKTTLKITAQDTSGSNNDIQIALIGYKTF
jgi:hypothetical protein